MFIPVCAQFEPSDLPGLVLWLDATDVLNGQNPNNGDLINSWRDKSGLGNDAVQFSTSSMPSYVQEAILRPSGNFSPAVRFNSDWLFTGTLRETLGAVHVFVVSQRSVTQLGGQTYQRLISTSDGGDSLDWQLPDWSISSPNNAGDGTSIEYSPLLSIKKVLGGKIANLRIGQNAASANGTFQGDIAEILVFSQELTGSNLTDLIDYLEQKWIAQPLSFASISTATDYWAATAEISAMLTTDASLSDANVTVFWDVADRGTDPLAWSNSQTFSNVSVGSIVSVPITNLAQGETYHYRLFAANTLAEVSAWSGPHSLTIRRGPVGAIRWDAWVGDLSTVGLEVERNLSPAHYHSRVPFYGQIVASDEVLVRATTQEIIDKEIAFARAAGLDYWAYIYYDGALATARLLHQSSQYSQDMNFCIIDEGARASAGGTTGWPDRVDQYLELFKQPNYQTVLNGRPLLFILNPQSMVGPVEDSLFLSDGEVVAALNDLRNAVLAEGLPSPYLVAMNMNVNEAILDWQTYGFDAVTSYAMAGTPNGAEPFANLVNIANTWWNTAKNSGAKVITNIGAGWDRRPRIENPVSWEPTQQPGVGIQDYYLRPTPQELGSLVQDARTWSDLYRSTAEADTVIIYAWNEIDEGGWIVPTLSDEYAHLEAIRDALGAPFSNDEDSMSDLWETWHFDSPRKADAVTNHDADKMNDQDEYIAVTDPNDGTSYFSMNAVADAVFEFSWMGKTGRNYRVWKADSLSQGQWSLDTISGVLASDQLFEVTKTLAQPEAYYRVEVMLPGQETSIAVDDPSFENGVPTASPNWRKAAILWNPANDNDFQQNSGDHISAADGTWATRLAAVGSMSQDLETTVSPGDTLSISFQGGSANAGKSTEGGGVFDVSFIVDGTTYSSRIDTTALPAGTWSPYSFTAVVTNTGNLSIEFSHVSGEAWLDDISSIQHTVLAEP